jgi:hypothetical protein
MIKFGIDLTDIEAATRIIGSALSTQFAAHASDFRGGNYYRADLEPGTVFLQWNHDPLDLTPFELSWPAEKVVLYLDGPDNNHWTGIVSSLAAMQQLSLKRLE